jgi:hypothetical protein
MIMGVSFAAGHFEGQRLRRTVRRLASEFKFRPDCRPNRAEGDYLALISKPLLTLK